MNIELRHLRSFVAVAEELNFTRAAKRLFIAQQALSSQIKQLEERVGTRLFERDTRKVSLTPAGEALYQQAMPLLAGADAAVEAARAAAEPAKRIVVGFVAAVHHAFYASALSRYSGSHSDVETFVHFGDQSDPTGGLRSGRSDVAFTYGPFDRSGIETVRVFSEPLGAVMAADHPLASVNPLPLQTLLDQPTFDFITDDPIWRDYWMATAQRDGRPPTIVAQFHTLDALVEALRMKIGVHTGTRSLAELGGPDLVWREMPDLPVLDHFVAYRTGETRTHVLEFVAAVGEAFHVDTSEVVA